MRSITKKIAALFMVAAIMAMTAMTSLAETHTAEMFEATMYGYEYSSDLSYFIDSIAFNDGIYTVTFKERGTGPIRLYISEIETADGTRGVLDGTTMTLTFTPDDTEFTGLYRQADRSSTPVDKAGTLITYGVTMSGGRYPGGQGALVVD